MAALAPGSRERRQDAALARWCGGLTGSALVHALLALAAVLVTGGSGAPLQGIDASTLVAVDVVEPPPAPEPPPEVAPPPDVAPPPAPEPQPEAPVALEPPAPVTEAAPAAAAEALTTENGDAFSITTGSGDDYSGGYTTRDGSGDGSGSSIAPGATMAPSAPAPRRSYVPPPGPQVSRRPSPKNGTWNLCRFPDAAADADLGDAKVNVVVHVTEDGRPLSVDVLFEPHAGYGFGESARRCLMKRRYHPGRDTSGNRIATETDPFTVTILRHP